MYYFKSRGIVELTMSLLFCAGVLKNFRDSDSWSISRKTCKHSNSWMAFVVVNVVVKLCLIPEIARSYVYFIMHIVFWLC